MAISAKNRARVEELATELFELLGGRYKPDGKSKTFDEIELETTELGDLITSLAIQNSVAEQMLEENCARCPKCDRLGKKLDPDDDEAMVLQTARGEVEWMTEGYFCRRCRRSFFPSAG